MSGQIIASSDEAEVDHYDMDFVDLVSNWVNLNGGEEYIYSKINETEDGSEITEFTDSELTDNFIQYHNLHSHLRILTIDENRKRKKSKR